MNNRLKESILCIGLVIALSFMLTACTKNKENDIVKFENVEIDNEIIHENIDESKNEDESDYFASEYVDDNGDVNLNIEKNNDEDNKYNIEIGIFRLTLLDDGIGYMKNNIIYFTATDASGNPIKGKIEKTESGANVTFTDSTWAYIKNGDIFSYNNKK